MHFILLFASNVCFAQDTTLSEDFHQRAKLFVKVYGGITPILSEEINITTPNQALRFPNYEHDVGYNAGVSLGYFVSKKLVLQVSFEKKENRLFISTSPNDLSLFSTKLNTNTIFCECPSLFHKQRKTKSLRRRRRCCNKEC